MDDDIITLVVESKHYEFSKTKLASSSSYFNVMFNSNFSEKSKSTIQLQGVSVWCWEQILYYLKYGKIYEHHTLTVTELLNLLQSTCMLQFVELQELCSNHIHDSLNVDNAIEVLEAASRLDYTSLIQHARAVVLWDFEEVSQSEAFLKLNFEQVEGYLGDPALHSASGEWGVWEAIDRWISCSPDEPFKERIQFLPKLIKCLRLNGLTMNELTCIGLHSTVLSCPLMTKVILRLVKERGAKLKNLKLDFHTDTEETLNFIEEWEKTEPRKIPLVPSVVGNIHTENGKTSPCILKFCEAEKSFVPYLRLCKVENTLGSMVGFKVISSGSKLFLLGGVMMTRQGAWNHAVWMYDQICGSWTFLSNLLKPSRHLFACCLKDELYVMGGFGRLRILQDSVCKLSLKNRVWTTCAPLPKPMYSAACCSFRNCIYVIEAFIYQYIPDTNHWITLNISPVAKGFSSAMASEDYIYLSGAYLKNVYRFDPSNPHSELKIVGEFKSECVQSCLIGDYVYSLSQNEFGEDIFCEKMDVRTGETTVLWEGTTDSKIADLNPRHHHGCFPLLGY